MRSLSLLTASRQRSKQDVGGDSGPKQLSCSKVRDLKHIIRL